MRCLPALLCLTACMKQIPLKEVKPQTLQLLAEKEERETDTIQERRDDLEFDVRDFDRIPHLVTTGETRPFDAENASARLFGDEAATRGFTVDNCVLLEVIASDNKVVGRAVVGFAGGLLQGKEVIDSLGRQSFTFEAGEINLTSILPERGVVKIRGTVLDYGGVGKVSSVYVKVAGRAGSTDDLQNQ